MHIRLLLSVIFTLALACEGGMTTVDAGSRDGAAAEASQSRDGGSGVDGVTGRDAAGVDGSRPRDGGAPPSLGCAPLPASEGTEVRVGPDRANDLPQIVQDAAPGTVILLEDGTYRMTAAGEGNRRLQFRQPNVTLRSASNNAEAVILDGEYETDEMIFILADNITIAHITITHAVDHGIHITGSGGNTEGAHLYGLRLIDHGEQFVKINPSGDGDFTDNGRIECSHFQLTDAGRPMIEDSFADGCYTGGIDTHSGWGWTVRQNRFEDIYCTNGGLAEHAVHFWSASRDTLVENNVIVNCARGVGFGLSEEGRSRDYPDNPYPGVSYIGHYDGIIRGNVIVSTIDYFDTGIELNQARGARVYHNTVLGAGAAFYSSIDYRFANTDVDIRNNITNRITFRNLPSGTVESNLEGASFDMFVDLPAGDGHLRASASAAIDQGEVVAEAGLDIDGQARSEGAPDLGADEHTVD